VKFRDLVMRGILPGEVVKENVILGKITPELVEIIESEQHGLLFEWQEPLILRKVSAPPEKAPKAEQGAAGQPPPAPSPK
jgi:hypothetical protein